MAAAYSEPIMDKLILVIIVVTAIGLSYQCFINQRRHRAEFLSFPIALLILFPYPIMGLLGLMKSDITLFGISLIMGIPNTWLTWQYFRFEWKYRSQNLSFEEKLTVGLSLTGGFLLAGITLLSDFLTALSSTGAYYTFCTAIFSFLLKMWRVSSGHENIDGLNWSTLITLCIFFGAMTYFVRSSDIKMLSIAYLFSTVSCLIAIIYKWKVEQSAKNDMSNSQLR